MTKILKKFKADEFARRIKSDFQSSEHSRYVFFPHLAPKNTTGETSTLDDSLQQVLKTLLLEKFDQTVIATRANLWISELSAGEKSRSFAFAQDDIVDGGSARAGLDPPYFTHATRRILLTLRHGMPVDPHEYWRSGIWPY